MTKVLRSVALVVSVWLGACSRCPAPPVAPAAPAATAPARPPTSAAAEAPVGESVPVRAAAAPALGADWRPLALLDALVAKAAGADAASTHRYGLSDTFRLSPDTFDRGFEPLPDVRAATPFRSRQEWGANWLSVEVRVSTEDEARPDEEAFAWDVHLRAGRGKGEPVEQMAQLQTTIVGLGYGPVTTCGGRLWAGVAMADRSDGTNLATEPSLHIFSWPTDAVGAPPAYEGEWPLGSYVRSGADLTDRATGAVYLLPGCRLLGLVASQTVVMYDDPPTVPAGWVLVYGDPTRCGTDAAPGKPPQAGTRWLETQIETCNQRAADPDRTCTEGARLWYPAPADLTGNYNGPGAFHHEDGPVEALVEERAPSCAWMPAGLYRPTAK